MWGRFGLWSKLAHSPRGMGMVRDEAWEGGLVQGGLWVLCEPDVGGVNESAVSPSHMLLNAGR